MRDISTIVIPLGQSAVHGFFREFIIFGDRIVQGLQHHKFMISDQHLYVRHRHDLPEDLYPIRISVYHIAKDIQGVFRLKVDLL